MSRNDGGPDCPYCHEASEKVIGKEIYPYRADLWFKTFYRCEPCDAYVGCHPGTEVPLGRLANAELRAAKQMAHLAFDRKWKDGGMKRNEAYRWLAETLGIHKRECHIGMFDVSTCRRVVEVCEAEA